MNEKFVNDLEQMYLRYGYEPQKHSHNLVFLFTKGIYNGADIVKRGVDDNIEELRKEYADLGYAVKVRDFKDIEEAEECLFKDFFRTDIVCRNLRERYEVFVNKLMLNLPKDSAYEYIKSPYDYIIYSLENGESKALSLKDNHSEMLIDTVVEKMNESSGPLLVIIEAAAGYGKTCTAYEILNKFISISSGKLPFFTELSRDRKASIFKHILAFEIEEQFSNRVDSSAVIHQIKKGRIPLIIDGFDELISKDFSFSSSHFEQVESMISTVVDLLTDNAKVIITSRKTAIFNSEEFHNWMIERDISYTLLKISIAEPSVKDWLSNERIRIMEGNNFPVDKLANPVLLTYLRYIDIQELRQIAETENSIVDRYFKFLLVREQTRQNLLAEPEVQLRIFRKLVRLFTELDVKSESKAFVKELILDYNQSILDEIRKRYTPDIRPRIDQIADMLSNHAFLDRKDKDKIGILNEFILGTLIGDNLTLGEYSQYSEEFYKEISQTFALLAVQAYQVQPKEKKEKLWEVFNGYDFSYDQQFYFKIDIELKGELKGRYKEASLSGFKVFSQSFNLKKQFEFISFIDCIFIDCSFSLDAFQGSLFVNCSFFDCSFSTEGVLYSEEYLSFFSCLDNNGFIQKIFETDEDNAELSVNIEKKILSLYFKRGSLKPKHKQLSKIKNDLSSLDLRSVNRSIHKLRVEGLILVNGDLSFLTQAGISRYNDLYRRS